MKFRKSLLTICLIPLLIACDNSNNSKNNNSSSSGTNTLPDVYAYNPSGAVPTGTENTFSLQEYPSIVFTIKSEIGGKITLTEVNNKEEYEKLIEEELYERKIFASDIDGDGYRELIYLAKGDSRAKAFRVYDVHNDKVLFKEERLNEISKYISGYSYNLTFKDNKVTFLPYLGNYSEGSTVDYGHLHYSKDRNFYFDWENKLGIKSLQLNKMYIAPDKKYNYTIDECTVLNPNNSVYTFDLTHKYVMEMKVNYIDPNNIKYTVTPSGVSFYREDLNKIYWKTYNNPDSINPKEDVHQGILRIEFELYEEFENRTWEFFIREFLFTVNAKVVAN